MKKLVEFKLHAGKLPYFIENRFPFINDAKYIGITLDDKECYIPETLIELTRDIVVSKVISYEILNNELTDFLNPNAEKIFYTEAEKITLINNWLDSVL